MKFVDLGTQYARLKSEIDRSIQTVLDHGQYVNGPEVELLEKKLADKIGTRFCISTANGSDALLLALIACGIKEGDEVLTTPFTYVATTEMICRIKAKPVFVDIKNDDFNIETANLERFLTEKTRAILPVNIFGKCANFEAIGKFSVENNILVIEDAAQSLGADYKGTKSGALGLLGCTSFFPSKPLGCYGDGGAIFTNNEEIASTISSLKNHGQSAPYKHDYIGFNSRLDSIQAAILLAKLKTFDHEIEQRAEHAKTYNELLSDLNKEIITPNIPSQERSAWAQYTIRIRDRDEIVKFLTKRKIPVTVYYKEPIYFQPAYLSYGYQGLSPRCEIACKEVLSLPFYPGMSMSVQQSVCSALREALHEVTPKNALSVEPL